MKVASPHTRKRCRITALRRWQEGKAPGFPRSAEPTFSVRLLSPSLPSCCAAFRCRHDFQREEAPPTSRFLSASVVAEYSAVPRPFFAPVPCTCTCPQAPKTKAPARRQPRPRLLVAEAGLGAARPLVQPARARATPIDAPATRDERGSIKPPPPQRLISLKPPVCLVRSEKA